MTTQGTDSTILAEPATSSAKTNPPAAVEVLPKNEVMVPATKMDNGALKDLGNTQTASPGIGENLIILTTRLGDKPVSATTSNQVEGEGPCILIVTTSIGRLNLKATGVSRKDDCWEPPYGGLPPGTLQRRKGG